MNASVTSETMVRSCSGNTQRSQRSVSAVKESLLQPGAVAMNLMQVSGAWPPGQGRGTPLGGTAQVSHAASSWGGSSPSQVGT